MSTREAVLICCRREHLRSTVTIALIVGTILMIINHADVILRGDATATTWIKVGLSYCVPFVVSNLGLLAGKRAEIGRGLEPIVDAETADAPDRAPGVVNR